MGYSVPRYKRGTSERLANALVALFVHSMSIVRESTRNSRQGDIETHFFFFAAIIEFQVKELKSGEFFFLLLQGLKVVSKRPIKQEVKSPAQISIKPLPQILKN